MEVSKVEELFLLRQHATFYLLLPDQLHRKYYSCLDIQSQNGKLLFYFSWPVWLGQSQSHSGLFQLRGKKTGINQIMWKTQCLHHTLPSAESKQPIRHQWVSKYTHSWTNMDENKGMQAITLVGSHVCQHATLQRGALETVVALKGSSRGEPAAPGRAASACTTDLGQELPASAKKIVVFSLCPHVCMWFSS